MIDATARDIRDMRTHSSSVVARKAAEALRSITDREYENVDELLTSLERNSRILRQSNPSHAWLQSSQWEIVDRVNSAEAETPERLASVLIDAIDETVAGIDHATTQAGRHATSVLEDGDVILTHDYSTTVFAGIEAFLADNNELQVYATESRPRHMGRRMARQLGALDGVEVTLIVDSASGHSLEQCDHVMVGMDCIVDDRFYNRIGTLPIASTAAHLGVPVSVLGASAKIIEGAFTFANEQRDSVEVLREPSPEFTIENYPYDVTPLSLVEHIITESGVASP